MNNLIPSWTYKYDIDENRNDYIKLINQVFDSGRLLFGEELENFQEEFAKYIGVKYGIGCDNATNGLFLALKSIGIEQDDEVITVPNTAIPTISAIRQAGAKPVFVDINNYGLMDINELEKSINKKTKAIIPVHLYGFPCDIKRICEISKIFKIPVIEDCSQAHGSEFDNKKVGSFGDLSGRSIINDLFHAVERGEVRIQITEVSDGRRLDHYAQKYYGNGLNWWIIAAASGIGWWMQITEGIVLNIPTNIEDIEDIRESI